MGLSTSGRNDAVDGATANMDYMSLHSADPSTTGANEISGGSPAYARKAATWDAASSGSGAMNNDPVFDVPGSTTVSHFGFWTASSGGTFKGGGALSASETFGAQGTYTATAATVAIT